MRQDDNGNRFVVAGALTEAEAHRQVASYAARAHKQLYWAEPMTVGPESPVAVVPSVTEPPAPANRS